VFDIDHFAAACRAALTEHGSDAIREVVRRAVSEPSEVIAALGEQTGAFAGILVRAPDLTILNVVWGTRQWTLPHNHLHRAIIGMYGGGGGQYLLAPSAQRCEGAGGGGWRGLAS
jgi:predicted metal-dependent enzyme (double-stranded beta helix superfamily)